MERRVGLNLTARTLASVIKKDKKIPVSGKEGSDPVKGYYDTEKDVVKEIKKHLLDGRELKGNQFKTLECQIMDIADDISNATYDLEDCLKAGFTSPLNVIALSGETVNKLKDKIQKKLKLKKFTKGDVYDLLIKTFQPLPETTLRKMYSAEYEDKIPDSVLDQREYQIISSIKASDGYARTQFTSDLVGTFIRGIQVENRRNKVFAKVSLKEDVSIMVKLLKYLTHETIVMSPRVKISEYRGYEIVTEIFDALNKDSQNDKAPKGVTLLPEDVREIYESYDDENLKKRTICDFIAGMTDRYAIEFYGRLKSENPQTIFKPF